MSKYITMPTTWTKSGSPYIIKPQSGYGSISVSSDLIIEPGVVVKFYNSLVSLNITGLLTAVGTPEEKIVFTSLKDDAYGGDSNGDGASTVPQKGDWYAIVNNGKAIFDNAVVLYGSSSPGTGAIFSYSNNLTVKNSTIRYAAYSGIALYNVSTAVIENNVISDNTTGIRLEKFVSGKTIKVSNNVIVNNLFGATVAGITLFQMSVKLSAENNWWGDKSGPYYSPGVYYGKVFPVPANLSGKGNLVTDGVSFNPWLSKDPFAPEPSCIDNCYSNILFLPGVEASRLYRPDGSGEDRLWEPNSNSDVKDLLLNDEGKSIRNDIYTKDVIDNAYLPNKGNIYKSFLNDLDDWKNTDKIINDYAVIPYDWRLSLEDVLSETNIIQKLRDLAESSMSKKVTIIAHSNGGLVAKALTDKLGVEVVNLIDKIVFVAVPQSGTPQAIGAILHGYDQGLPVNWMPFAMSPKMARTLARNMPSAYNLLPSQAYFFSDGSSVKTPVIIFDDGEATHSFVEKYGEKIDDFSHLDGFLRDDDGKVSADSSNLESPGEINEDLLNKGEDTHYDLLDNWSPPAGVSVYQIAGFGEETVGTIKYWTGKECLHEGGKICSSQVSKLEYTPELVVDGDGTVVAPSALAMQNSGNVKKYWIDLDDYNDVITIERKHAGIFEVSQLRDFIRNNILTQSSASFPNFISNSEPTIDSENRLRYFLHSPLALSARDSAGNKISASVSEIPGASYGRFGEVQYISLPASSHPTIMLDGEDTGSFTLEVQETEGNVVTAETTFSGIPNTSDTKATMDFPDGTIKNASFLNLDYDGDGKTEFKLKPKEEETVVWDLYDPVTNVLPSGVQGKNDWYVSDVIIALTASDEGGSGLDKTRYSFDNGDIWKEYNEPLIISQEGITTIKYFSVDNQGNKEETKTEIIKIDKTTPEISFFFDPTSKNFVISGNDGISSVTENMSETSFTVTDEAGHTATAAFAKNEAGKQIKFEIKSLDYDNVAVSLPDNAINYEWSIEKTGDVKMLNEKAVAGDMEVQAHYLAKDDMTIIKKTENSITTSETKQGLVVLQLITEKGNIKINY